MTAEVRQSPHADEVRAASIRALSGDRSVRVRGQYVFRDDRAVRATAPHLYPDAHDSAATRGAADGFALRLLHSDEDLHAGLRPDDPTAALVFEMLEQFRVESLFDPAMPGVSANLQHRHAQWSSALHASGLTETAQGLLLYTVALVARAQVTGVPVTDATADQLEATRGELSPVVGATFARLRRDRRDQRAYAQHALTIADHIAERIAAIDPTSADAGESSGHYAFPLLIDLDDDQGRGAPTTRRVKPRWLEAPVYHAFTTAYDREVRAVDLVREELIRANRQRLDELVLRSRANVRRLARELHRTLASLDRGGWSDGHEEGHLDARRLSRLVTTPTDRRVFRFEDVRPAQNTLVTLLIDCSGSMKTDAEQVAVFADVLGHALDIAGVTSEVLGYTTGAWNGGRTLRDWIRAGRPERPGRLNEVCHLVLKDADAPWRSGRRGLAALLKRDLFREGIDGEAVAWAGRRMGDRPEHRRILIVVSDGSPMDGATHRANGRRYLDDHLRTVVDEQVERGVEIIGVGVNPRPSDSYPRSVSIDLENGIGLRWFSELLRTMTPTR